MSGHVKIVIFLFVIMLLSLISTGLTVFPEKPIFLYKSCETICFAVLTLIYESRLQKVVL